MDNSDDTAPIQGPPIDRVWLARRRERLVEEAEETERIRARVETETWFAEMKASLDAETAAWAALPCNGDLDRVMACSDAFAETCPRRQHIMCARRQLAEAQAEAVNMRRGMRSDARRYGVPDRLISLVWDTEPEQTEAIRLLNSAQEDRKRASIVVLSGGVGCGKSCAAALWAIEQGARFVTASDLARVSPYEEKADKIAKSKCLVIDDLGTEYLDPKGFFLSHLDGLINERYANDLQTVITTNLDAEGFRRYGERVLDRIREAGKFLKVGGKSMRKRS